MKNKIREELRRLFTAMRGKRLSDIGFTFHDDVYTITYPSGSMVMDKEEYVIFNQILREL